MRYINSDHRKTILGETVEFMTAKLRTSMRRCIRNTDQFATLVKPESAQKMAKFDKAVFDEVVKWKLPRKVGELNLRLRLRLRLGQEIRNKVHP